MTATILALCCTATANGIPLLAAQRSLAPRAFEPLPTGATKPLGWMKTRLDAQDAGLCGNQYLGGGAQGVPGGLAM